MTSSNGRRLVAVMFTDVVGYTAMMQEDEEVAREGVGHRWFDERRSLEQPHHDGQTLPVVGNHARRDQISHLINHAPLTKESLIKEPPTSLSDIKFPRTD